MCFPEVPYEKVQVLLSAYNGEQYISEQIQSILNQTHMSQSW